MDTDIILNYGMLLWFTAFVFINVFAEVQYKPAKYFYKVLSLFFCTIYWNYCIKTISHIKVGEYYER